MKIATEDLKILSILHGLKNDETITVNSVAGKIYPNSKTGYESNANCNKIISRFRKLQDYGLIDIHKESGKNFYDMDMDRCFIGSLKQSKPKINGKFMFLLVTDKKTLEDKWVLFEL